MKKVKPSTVFPYLRSCRKECNKPIAGKVKGEIPTWIKGCLIRIGSGLLEIGEDKFNHVFDGMALMHRFGFQNGRVTYQNRFLRSDSYCRNMKANKIVTSGFATRGAPDPCKTIFQRFTSIFSSSNITDNDAVCIIMYGGEAYACSETPLIWKIDPDTLESIEKVNVGNYVPVQLQTAHVHEDRDGTIYNIGTSVGLNCCYNILKFPPKGHEDKSPFDRGSVLCRIPAMKFLNPCYYHSFGMSENYIIFIEQPLFVSVSTVVWSLFASGTISDAMHCDENALCRFHIIRKSDGQLLDIAYVARTFFVFHHINAYEEDDHLVFDLCGYEKGEIIQKLYVKALEDFFHNPSPKSSLNPFEARAIRFVLPLTVDKNSKDTEKSLVTLPKTEATAYLQDDGTVLCKYEVLTGSEPWSPELPRINYENFNGRKYRYFYAVARNKQGVHVIKVDGERKETLSWNQDGAIPSEPVFMADPNVQNPDEDSGVLLVSLLFGDDENKVALLVLDAKTMKEIGRVLYKTASSVPGDFHATFIQNKIIKD